MDRPEEDMKLLLVRGAGMACDLGIWTPERGRPVAFKPNGDAFITKAQKKKLLIISLHTYKNDTK